MSHRLSHGALALLCSTLATLAACGGGTDEDPTDANRVDAPAIDATEVDAPTADAPETDAPTIDAASIDAAADAMTDAAPDATTDAGVDATTDAMVPLAGETCQIAELITIAGGVGNTTVTGTTVNYNDNYEPPTPCTGYPEDGPDHVYEISVPAGQRLTAAATPESSYDVGVYIVGTPAALCDATPIVCLGGDDTGFAGALDSARYDNTGGTAQSVFIVIDGTSAIGGTYSLAVTVAAIPPSTGEACGDADVITISGGVGSASGSTEAGEGYVNDYNSTDSSCASDSGNDHVYVVTVPDGVQMGVVVTPTSSGFDPSLNLVAGPASACAANPLVCIDGADDGASDDAETLSYANSTGNPVDVFIIVDAYTAGEEGTFELDVGLGIGPGDTCQAGQMVTLTSGMATVTGNNAPILGYVNDYEPPTACTTYLQDGPDRVHIVDVPNGATLTATVTPHSEYDAGIYLIAGPAAACDVDPIVCLAGRDMGTGGAAETVTYDNTSGSTVQVMVVVDSYDIDEFGRYSLALQVQ